MSTTMCSGYGQYHTNETDPQKPDKKLTPYASITWANITALVDKPQQVDKARAQWLIPSTLPSRNFTRQEVEGQFWVLWADLDTNPPALQRLVDVLALEIIGACDFEVYSSRGATLDRPKARILIPLHQPLSGGEWVLAQQVLNDKLQRHQIEPDRKSEGAAQLCYLPNRGEHYKTASQRTGERFDPLQAWAEQIAAKRQAQADAAAALEAGRKAAAERKAARAAQTAATGRPSLIDAFNEAYTVDEILLQAGYDQRGHTFRHPASESGSYSASVKDGRVHSLSSADPLYTGGRGGGAHDAFSAFEVLMHGGDRNAALRDAGDNWLTIGDETWNTVTGREWAQRQAQESQPLPGSDEDGVVNDMPPLFAVVPFADLAHTQPAPPSYWWDGYLPAGVVTLLGAHGGTGKSMVALMLAVSIAQGLPLFGIATRRGKVAFFSGEDGAELVRYRLRWICEKLGIDVASLQGRLHILDATGGEPTLFHEVSHKGNRQGLTTPSYAALREFIDANGIDVLIIDNASDAFDASEIDRARVRGFMRALFRIAQARAGAVMLLAHVDKGTSRGDRQGTESYSGSTAWHNSARSRLYLSRDKEGGGLLLEHQKHNLGRMAEPLRLTWLEGGIPQAEESFGPVVQGIADRGDMKSLIKLIHEFTSRGEPVSTATTSRTHAGKLLRGQPGFPVRLKKDGDVFDLLRQADRRGWLERELSKGSNRHEREVWKVTAAGIEAAGIKPAAPTAPAAPTSEVSAPDAAEGGCADCADFSARGCGGELRAREAGAMADEEAT